MKHPSQSVETFDSEHCRLVVVQDHHQVCPYLPDQTARMPLKLPIGGFTAQAMDWLLENGYRRSGEFVYRTQCPACDACEPTRIEVRHFRWTKSFRRVFNRGRRELEYRWQTPTVDSQRVELFNLHRNVRNLASHDGPIDDDSYAAFLVSSFGRADELSLYHDGNLVCVSIVDVGAESLSAVYTFFDPQFGRYSLGTYAILRQIQRAVDDNLRFVYLGMYVAENSHLNYKGRFGKQERRIRGRWTVINGD